MNPRNDDRLYHFIEVEDFTAAWSDLRLTLDDFFRLQDQIRIDPSVYPVIPGTGGLRKMCFAPPSSGRGKRGSLRVCYAYLHARGMIVLVFVYPKNAKDNLSPKEKKGVKSWLALLERELEQRSGKK
jgi:hypothetical protein